MIKLLKLAVAAIVTLGSLLGIFATISWIAEIRIDAKINSKEFRAELAKSLQSSIVFNANGSILEDPSDISSDYIDKIEIKWTPDYGSADHGIVKVIFKKFIPVEPTLTCYGMPIRTLGKHVDTFSWEFDISAIQGWLGPDMKLSDSSTRFLLTIIK